MRPDLLLLSLTVVSSPLLSQAPDTSLRAYPARGAASGRVETEHDPQQNKTILQLAPVALGSTLSMTALVALDAGTSRAPPNGVVLTLWSTAADRPLARDRTIALTLGSASFDLGTAWLTPQSKAGYTEVAMKAVPLGLWLALAKVDTAALRVGDRSFPLSAETLSAIREFASRMAPAGSPK